MATTPFQPMTAATVNVSVSAVTQQILIENFSGCNQIRVYNAGTATAFVDFGNSAMSTTVTTGIPIPAGAVEVFSAGTPASAALYAAVIAAGSTGTIYFTPGVGI